MSHARVGAPSPPPDHDEQSLRQQVLRLQARVSELEATALGNEDALTTVFATLAHELRSPLQTLILNAALCVERGQAEKKLPRWLAAKLDKQLRMAGRINLLIDTFLNVGQIAAGQLRLQRELVDLGGLVREVHRRVADDLTWAGCQTTVDASDGVTGQWDRLQIDLVITNLLSNAMKYGAGRPIEITVGGTADRALLRVQDHGPGIARADQGRIFEKFTRLGSPFRVGGFGLGLWIVAHIVDASGGRIEVNSDLGRGAEFLVWLPRLG